jgi:hypothetical protein
VNASWETLTGLVRAATVQLDTDWSLGTGFFIAPGIVATCAHVVESDYGIPARAVRGRLVAADRNPVLEIVKADGWFSRGGDEGHDMAFLHAQDCDDIRPVLVAPGAAPTDPMWTFGHPDGDFRNGFSANVTYEGPSQAAKFGTVLRGRVSGAGLQKSTGTLAHWLDYLDDDQIRAGGWPYPGPRLRSYLGAAVRAAEEHPYPGVLDERKQPPLTAVYVRQQAKRIQDWKAEVPQETPQTAAQQAAAADQERPLSLEDLLKLQDSCVIIGDSGAGKSSLLRQALITVAARWNQENSHNVPGRNVIPVRVLATDLTAKLPLPAAIAKSVNDDLNAVGVKVPQHASLFGAEPLAGVQWLVLIDGLDEIPNRDLRHDVIRKLTGAMSGPGRSLYRFIVTTRRLPDRELPSGGEWAVRPYELQPFAVSQLPGFARAWFTELGLRHPDQVTDNFIRKLRSGGLTELAQSPLIATLLCQLHANNPAAPPPRGRTEIYDNWVGLLVGTRLLGKPSADPGEPSIDRDGEPSAGGLRAQLEAVLYRYGAEGAAAFLVTRVIPLVCQLAAARMDGDTDPSADLLAVWTSDDCPANVPWMEWRSLLAELLRRSGLLRERAGDLVFVHRTITEYLAALHTVSDAERSREVFRRCFGTWTSAAPGTAAETWVRPEGDLSFERFVIAEWTGRPEDRDRPFRPPRPVPAPSELPGALLRLAEHGGINGCTQIVLLYHEKARLGPAVVATAIQALIRFADVPSMPRQNPRSSRIRRVRVFMRDRAGSSPLTDSLRKYELATAQLMRDWIDIDRHESSLERAWSIMLLDELGDTRSRSLLNAFINDPAIPATHLWESAESVPCSQGSRIELWAAVASRAAVEIPASVRDSPEERVFMAGSHVAGQDATFRLAAARRLADANDPRGKQFLADQATGPAGPDLVIFKILAAKYLAEKGDQKGDQKGVDLLIERATDPATGIEGLVEAEKALAELGDARGIEILQILERSEDDRVKVLAAKALIEVRQDDSIDVLADLAAKFYQMQRWRLSQANPESSAVTSAFRQVIEPCIQAAEALADRLDNRGLDVLADVAAAPEVITPDRTRAARALERNHDPRGTQSLVNLVEQYLDPHRPPTHTERILGFHRIEHFAITMAAEALKDIGDPRGPALLARLSERERRHQESKGSSLELYAKPGGYPRPRQAQAHSSPASGRRRPE